ncbi:hypothetical protein INT44_004829 [Umbelopsis vinacea]|uniref:Uncharacterized protein n=1 Tax=Umbelopsis vinacea TaxID=44442 RepID=A0A8H7Q8M0_9FUNG|nr:hypothetical protein INT44_004829 [Umbelopsis vinacea]
MGSFLDEIFSDPKRAFKKRMSVSSTFSLPNRKKSSALHISSPVLTHASGIYSNTSPDRSTFLVDLSNSEYSQCSPATAPSEDSQFLSREPRKSCPDIRLGNSFKSRDHKYRAQKMEEFESMIEDTKVSSLSVTPDYASS